MDEKSPMHSQTTISVPHGRKVGYSDKCLSLDWRYQGNALIELGLSRTLIFSPVKRRFWRGSLELIVAAGIVTTSRHFGTDRRSMSASAIMHSLRYSINTVSELPTTRLRSHCQTRALSS